MIGRKLGRTSTMWRLERPEEVPEAVLNREKKFKEGSGIFDSVYSMVVDCWVIFAVREETSYLEDMVVDLRMGGEFDR
jgi:hypothetical protein